jgi:hypothetical protein
MPIGRGRFAQLSRFTRKYLLIYAIRHRFRFSAKSSPKTANRHLERFNRCTSNSSFWNNGSRDKSWQRQVCPRQGK